MTREPLTQDRYLYKEGDLGEWRFSNDNFGGQWLSKDGKTLHYCQGQTIPRFPPCQTRYDNLWSCNRILVVWSTRDGAHWAPTYFSMPTENDPLNYQHYGVRTFTLEDGNLRLAYLYAYNQATQQIYLELNFSRDGIYWQRFLNDPPLAANGPPGSWNFGHMHPNGPSVEKDGMVHQLLGYCSNAPHFIHEFIYNRDDLKGITPEYLRQRLEGKDLKCWPFWPAFGSWEALHDLVGKASQTVGIMSYRKNGWVSIQPEGEQGALVTKALTAGKTLTINARTRKGGVIRVEALNAKGAAIESHSGNNAAVFTGDAIDAPLSWSHGAVKELPPGPIHVRVTLTKADLYALNWGR